MFQHILWRDSPEQKIQKYELFTVTYGLSSAPFLSIRVLHTLDAYSEPLFSVARSGLTNHTYVDDIVVGRNTEAELSQVQNHTIGLVRSAGCNLKKWCSDNYGILVCFKPEDRTNCPFEPKDESSYLATHSHGTHKLKTRPIQRKVYYLPLLTIGALGPMLLWEKSFM